MLAAITFNGGKRWHCGETAFRNDHYRSRHNVSLGWIA